MYKLLIQLKAFSSLILLLPVAEELRSKMNELASTLPEYATVMGMYGVGKTFGPQLIAEIGDISNFSHREALTALPGRPGGVGSVRHPQFKE